MQPRGVFVNFLTGFERARESVSASPRISVSAFRSKWVWLNGLLFRPTRWALSSRFKHLQSHSRSLPVLSRSTLMTGQSLATESQCPLFGFAWNRFGSQRDSNCYLRSQTIDCAVFTKLLLDKQMKRKWRWWESTKKWARSSHIQRCAHCAGLFSNLICATH